MFSYFVSYIDLESQIHEAIKQKKGKELQRLKEQFEAAAQVQKLFSKFSVYLD